ncbi:MAG: NAD(P)H-hydrate dehydratase [Bacteroidales bacterium]
MKLFASQLISQIDKYTIENEPILSISLMERAALACTIWIKNRYPVTKQVKVFVGPGNNGGDGLAIARQLANSGYQVTVYLVKIASQLSADAQVNLNRLNEIPEISLRSLTEADSLPSLSPKDLIVDSLFGSGLSRPLEGLAASVVSHINKVGAQVVAIDIPSGLFGENNQENNGAPIIRATYTLTLQFPKVSFFFSENYPYIGHWDVLPIGLHEEKIRTLETPYYYTLKNNLQKYITPRQTFGHKGTFGHGLLIAGSYGKMGAAVLSSRAALRTGLGLLSSHIPKSGYTIMQTAVPESMVSIDWSDIMFTTLPDLTPFNAIGVGPGLGTKPNSIKALLALIGSAKVPMVIDADGLNILSQNQQVYGQLPKNTILTPHPKEFERLVGPVSSGYDRMQKAREFAQKYQIILVVKGAYTMVVDSSGKVMFNSTGNPGMGTAGSGDVLTGILLGLLAQGYAPIVAARMGVFLHGLAGDLAAEKHTQLSMVAGDIIEQLGAAYNYLMHTDERNSSATYLKN